MRLPYRSAASDLFRVFTVYDKSSLPGIESRIIKPWGDSKSHTTKAIESIASHL